MKYDPIKDLLSKVPKEKKNDVCTSAIRFICISLKEMKERLLFNNEVFNLAQMIFFEEGYDEGKWLKLKDLFPNILRSKKQKDDFTGEVRKVEYTYRKIREKLRNSTSKISPIVLWENESGTYPNIHLLIQSLFVLPYSSVPVERYIQT